jgi:Na+/H+-dicarboxylate symporter
LEILASLFTYTLVTAGGLLTLLMIYPLIVKMFSGMSPGKFMRGIRPAQLVAFSTSSSGATLPVTMECTEDNLGVSKEVASFVLPLGATVNMDGTALYQGVATMFIAQVYGIPLDLGAQLMIVLTATLASIGTAAAPGVGLLMLVIVLQQVGVPLEGIALILAVDRLLDMLRTVINITSDATAAVIVASTEGQLNEPPNISKNL